MAVPTRLNAAPPAAPSAAPPARLSSISSSEIQRWMQAPRPTPEALETRIQALLSHYFRPDVTEDAEEMALDDWTAVLGHHPAWAIQTACRSYLRSNPRKRPTPGEVSALCEAEIGRLDRELSRRAPPPSEPPRHKPTEEERARVADLVADFTGKRKIRKDEA